MAQIQYCMFLVRVQSHIEWYSWNILLFTCDLLWLVIASTAYYEFNIVRSSRDIMGDLFVSLLLFTCHKISVLCVRVCIYGYLAWWLIRPYTISLILVNLFLFLCFGMFFKVWPFFALQNSSTWCNVIKTYNMQWHNYIVVKNMSVLYDNNNNIVEKAALQYARQINLLHYFYILI